MCGVSQQPDLCTPVRFCSKQVMFVLFSLLLARQRASTAVSLQVPAVHVTDVWTHTWGIQSTAPLTCPSLILTKGVHRSGLVREARVLLALAQERGGTLRRVPLLVVLPLYLVALNLVVGLLGESTATKSSGSSF